MVTKQHNMPRHRDLRSLLSQSEGKKYKFRSPEPSEEKGKEERLKGNRHTKRGLTSGFE